MTDFEKLKVERFLKDYNELARKHGMYISPKLKDYRPNHQIAALECAVKNSALSTDRIDIGLILENGEWIMEVKNEK